MSTTVRTLAGRVLLGLLGLAAAATARAQSPAAATPRPARPSLVVILVVDQFRGDYVDRFGHQWRHGLRRVFDEGAYYTEAAYRYASTMTCAGHATIGTGAMPQIHGMIANVWYDRASGRDVSCTEDPAVANVSYGTAAARGGDSGARLATPTFADEMRAQLAVAPQVVTMSMKARSAVSLAGHRSSLSTWFDGPRGFVSSPAMGTGWPDSVPGAVPAAHPVEADADAVWTRTLPESDYLFEDAGAGEGGSGTLFPHPLAPPRIDGQLDPIFYANWPMSPFADEYVGRMAEAAIRDLKLGQGPGTDFLAVSFSALDTVGHAYGPRSHEVQDMLVRLDATIGRLLAALDGQVGPGRYALAFTSDHGVSPVPQQMHGARTRRRSRRSEGDRDRPDQRARRCRPRQHHGGRGLPLEGAPPHGWPRLPRTNGMRCARSIEQTRRRRARVAYHGPAGRARRVGLGPARSRGQAERLSRPFRRHPPAHGPVLVHLPDSSPRTARPMPTTSTCRWCSSARTSSRAATPRPPVRPMSRRHWARLIGVTLPAADGTTRMDALVAPPTLPARAP